MMKNNKPYYIIIFGLFLCICAPTLWSYGMFMDGLYYASISRNLANGLGSFWYLHHTDFSYPIFHEHPPLAIGIQSILFYFFGDSIFIERIYSLSTFIITAIIIHFIWVEIIKNEFKKLSWVPLLFWIIIPLNSWACSNNILENTMNIFVSLTVLMSLKSLKSNMAINILISGLLLSLGFLSKGFTALFPLSIFFWHFFIFKKITLKEMFLRTIYLLLCTVMPFLLLYLLYPTATDSLYQYLNQQVIKSVNNVQTVSNRFYIIKRFMLDLAPALGACLIIFYFSFRKKNKILSVDKKWIFFFLFLGISGVIPIMISMKQSSFYILTVFPFFCIALGILTSPFISASLVSQNTMKVYLLAFVTIIVSLFLTVTNIGIIGRDHKLIEDIHLILKVIPKNSTISIDKNMSKNYQLIGYFSRYGNISLDKDIKRHYHISYMEKNKEITNYKQAQKNLKLLMLFKRD